MKKLLYLAMLIPYLVTSQTNLYSYGFTSPTATMTSTDGWARTNQSTSPSTTSLWSVSSYTSVTVSSTVSATPFQNQVYTTGQTCPIPNGQDGTANTFALINFTSTTSLATSGATISNWLISPIISVQNGDVVTFYSRKGTSGTTDYADRLEFRMSSDATAVNPSSGPTDIGSFSTLCVSVNPTLDTGFVYPKIWTQYSYTVSGLTGLTPVNFGFRYFVTDGGKNGANSDIIGIDTFSVDRPSANTQDFFANNFSIQPNPVSDLFSVTTKNNIVIQNIKVIDINGRIVNEVNNTNSSDSMQVNVTELNTGVYFLKVQSELGVGTSKIIKK
jgi:hypothetical protein